MMQYLHIKERVSKQIWTPFLLYIKLTNYFSPRLVAE